MSFVNSVSKEVNCKIVYVGTGSEVGKRAAAIQGVTYAHIVTGPFDVILRADAPDIRELGTRVLRPIQDIDGVVRTMTCPIIHR